tara:strand:+ start:617 stop:778 length:162 start_codon:yes stop_codon:yes gene_type:complete
MSFKSMYWGDHGNNIVTLRGYVPANKEGFLNKVNHAIESHPVVKEEVLKTFAW